MSAERLVPAGTRCRMLRVGDEPSRLLMVGFDALMPGGARSPLAARRHGRFSKGAIGHEFCLMHGGVLSARARRKAASLYRRWCATASLAGRLMPYLAVTSRLPIIPMPHRPAGVAMIARGHDGRMPPLLSPELARLLGFFRFLPACDCSMGMPAMLAWRC